MKKDFKLDQTNLYLKVSQRNYASSFKHFFLYGGGGGGGGIGTQFDSD